jgi:acyl-CoA synthetase (NDP forming)
MNTFKILVLASTAFAAMATVPLAHAADSQAADMHAAKAGELQQKAEAANRKAAAHEVMALAGGSPKAAPGAMANHCERLIAKYRAEAAEYAAQAAEHQRAAE